MMAAMPPAPILVLESPVQHYAWGSREAIPALLGLPAPAEQPWAELWMGGHPAAPSQVLAPGGAVALDRLIAERPAEILGAEVAGRFGPRLPYLFKVLAAARPLSIQCHPDPEAARRGFQREERLGIPRDARERSYRDDGHKPELIAALGPFEALCGFRPPAEIAARLRAAGVREVEPELAALERDGLAGFFPALMGMEAGRAERAVREAAAGLAGDDSREAAWVRRLAREFPRDPAVLAPLYLTYLELARDQALHLGAGVLHAYLEGTGLEIMASSDNVLRGGLTDKHVDVGELCRVVRFEPLAPRPIAPEPVAPGLWRYRTPVREFELSFAELGQGAQELAGGGPAIVLCLGPACRIAGAEGAPSEGAPVELARGGAALVTAAAGRVRLEGEGRAYIASVPAAAG